MRNKSNLYATSTASSSSGDIDDIDDINNIETLQRLKDSHGRTDTNFDSIQELTVPTKLTPTPTRTPTTSPIKKSTISSSWKRRKLFHKSLSLGVACISAQLSLHTTDTMTTGIININPAMAIAATDIDIDIDIDANIDTNDEFGMLSKETISSLKFNKKLGKGTFKQVYSVVDDRNQQQYAMAVERLKSKSEARDELRGIRIVEEIQSKLTNEGYSYSYNYNSYFESIYGWWIQSTPIAPYEQNQTVFPTNSNNNRSRKQPTKQSFVKTSNKYYLISFKPLYDMDLKRFINDAFHKRYLIPCNPDTNDTNTNTNTNTNDKENKTESTSSKNEIVVIGGIPITEKGALQLVYDICLAGKIMHNSLGIIHRDIKPKNLMLKNGQIVIIDFGFANYHDEQRIITKSKSSNDNHNHNDRFCITEVAKVKGEVNYMLADDVALYRGCREGDAYAFGRTIYEVLFFGSSSSSSQSPPAIIDIEDSGKRTITYDVVQEENIQFRRQINSNDAATMSRFPLSSDARDCILSIVRQLCKYDRPISLYDAEQELSRSLQNL